MFSIPELKKVEEVMDIDFKTIKRDISVRSAVDEMIKNNRRTLMVVDENDTLEGIISMTDIHNFKRDNPDIDNINIESLPRRLSHLQDLRCLPLRINGLQTQTFA